MFHAEFHIGPLPGRETHKSWKAVLMRYWIAVLSIFFFNVPAGAEECIASVYWVGEPTQPGTETASGVPLDNAALTAAHKSLPLNSKVKVTNKQNGKTVTLTITDRGPYVSGRCIDVTKAGAEALGIAGLAPVNVAPSAED
jgi:rare lipoprotein A